MIVESGLVAGDSESANGLWFSDYASQPSNQRQSEEIAFQKLKSEIHASLVSSLDLVAAEGLSDTQMRNELLPFVEREIETTGITRSDPNYARLVSSLHDEMFGVGPLEPLMADPTVSDILVNHPYEVFVERNGQLELSEVVFADTEHLMRIIHRIVSKIGRRVDEVCPMVDARLPDGSRVNAVIPPLALDGPKLSIRRFGKHHLHLENLVSNGTLSDPMAQFLSAAVQAKVSVMISGGTGAGKTTLLNALSAKIPGNERIVTIEDSAELMLQHRHVARLETRPANSEGVGEVSQRDLVRNSLRMRPDRIILGEVRGREALDMLQAMNTGHEGSMTTIHANDTLDAIGRLEMMVAISMNELPLEVIRSYIASGISLLVHVGRLRGGVRRVTRVSEICKSKSGSPDKPYEVHDLFRFDRTGTDADGKAAGLFVGEGHRPGFLSRFEDEGIDFDPALFEHSSKPSGLDSGADE